MGHNTSNAWLFVKEKASQHHIVLLITVGIIAFLVGKLVELNTPNYPQVNELLSECITYQENNLRCSNAILKFEHEVHSESNFNIPELFSEVSCSLGIALFVSGLISMTIERRNREQFMQDISKKTKELSENVLKGMFNRDHHENLLTIIKEDILESPIIRNYLDIVYTLNVWKPPAHATHLKDLTFIKIHAHLTTEVRNILTFSSKEAGTVKLPLGLALPNPMIDELKKAVTLIKFSVNGKNIDQGLIKKSNNELQEKFKEHNDYDPSIVVDYFELNPKEKKTISAEYTMIKELEDTEVFRTLAIANSLSITVIDNTGLDLHIMAKSIHRRPLTRIKGDSSLCKWQLDDILFPQQGAMVFWKQRRPSKTPSPSPLSSTSPTEGDNGHSASATDTSA